MQDTYIGVLIKFPAVHHYQKLRKITYNYTILVQLVRILKFEVCVLRNFGKDLNLKIQISGIRSFVYSKKNTIHILGKALCFFASLPLSDRAPYGFRLKRQVHKWTYTLIAVRAIAYYVTQAVHQ